MASCPQNFGFGVMTYRCGGSGRTAEMPQQLTNSVRRAGTGNACQFLPSLIWIRVMAACPRYHRYALKCDRADAKARLPNPVMVGARRNRTYGTVPRTAHAVAVRDRAPSAAPQQ